MEDILYKCHVLELIFKNYLALVVLPSVFLSLEEEAAVVNNLKTVFLIKSAYLQLVCGSERINVPFRKGNVVLR